MMAEDRSKINQSLAFSLTDVLAFCRCRLNSSHTCYYPAIGLADLLITAQTLL